MVPLGSVGKSFVAELARLYDAFASGSALESVALRAAIVLPILVLKIPHSRSKVKEPVACLERRLKAWRDGAPAVLVKREGLCSRGFQNSPSNSNTKNNLPPPLPT